jgi:predicted nucleic acid-binding protein
VSGWLLDTNVLSELRRPRPNPSVLRFVTDSSAEHLYVSAATIAELRFGIEQLDDVFKRAGLNDWLDHTVRPLFEDRVLDLGEDILLKWRLLLEEGRTRGHTYSEPDLLIAATALHHGLTVVTRDTREYERANVPVLNPWVE